MASSSELPPNVFTQSTSPTKAGTGVSSVVPPELSSLPQEAIKKIKLNGDEMEKNVEKQFEEIHLLNKH